MNTRRRIFSLYQGSNNSVKQILAYNKVLTSFGSYTNAGIHRPLKLKAILQGVTETTALFPIQNNTYEPTVACDLYTGEISRVQSQVPNPFSIKRKSTCLSMPYSDWEHQFKFISDDLLNSTTIRKKGIRTFHTLTSRIKNDITFLSRFESNKTPEKEPVSSQKEAELTLKEKLQRAVTEYGSTVIIFHVGISLISLGTCYMLISSGLDMQSLLIPFGVNGGVVTNAGTFVTAYAIHKIFAPLRISITLAATPFIVRYLRNIGFLKKPKHKPKVKK